MIDWQTRTIPLFLTIPSIVIGYLLTGNILPSIAMFAIGTVMYRYKLVCGGDAMMLTIMGAFLGWVAIPVAVISFVIAQMYIKIKHSKNTPFAPFAFASSVLVIFGYETFKFYL